MLSKLFQSLQNKYITKKLSHSWILSGNADSEKLDFAKKISNWILCDNKSDLACGQCRSCCLFNENLHPDFYLIDNLDEKIQIDLIRELISELKISGQISKDKIVIINNAENMTQQAANAFLKTLEEPDDVYIFLLTSEKNKLLSTIISRTQEIDFFKFNSNVNLKFTDISKKIINDLNSIFVDKDKPIIAVIDDWSKLPIKEVLYWVLALLSEMIFIAYTHNSRYVLDATFSSILNNIKNHSKANLWDCFYFVLDKSKSISKGEQLNNRMLIEELLFSWHKGEFIK